MKWDEKAYTRTDENGNALTLEEYEQRMEAESQSKGRLSFLTKGEIKLLAIAGVGFFLDSYDLFIINLVTPIWTYQYWGGLDGKTPHYPPLLRGLVNAGANIGNIIGQTSFGFLGDALGRKFVYGKELILCMFGMIMVISLPNQIPTPTLKMIWIFVFRLIMGIGIGGDYPMSASITSERTHLKRRGMLLGWIFSNQGWGTLAGSICTVIILACYEHVLNVEDKYSKLNGVWRIQMALPLVPALITLWPRLNMPEGKKYLESQELNYSSSSSASSLGLAKELQKQANAKATTGASSDADSDPQKAGGVVAPAGGVLAEPSAATAKWNTFFVYFSEWRHLKTLLGTCSCWFLVDVSFYGTNLNQSVILTAIGFSKGKNEYHTLMKNTLGNLIIALAGYVPGYLFTIGLIEIMGRKWIQIQGFIITALMFGILAGDFTHLGTAGKFICLAIAQFFFNFGPNATTFIVPAEVFPSRVRGFAHGLSAAVGKLGAILAALLFNYLSTKKGFGLSKVLWIFFACNLLGAVCTYFLLPETKGRDADVIDYEEWLEKNPQAAAANAARKQPAAE